jgi:hypothetical protein
MPSSAAASEPPSSELSMVSPTSAGLRVAIRILGQLDHAGGVGRALAARNSPQLMHIVVPLTGSAAGHRIDETVARASLPPRTCSVSCAQPEQ